MFRNKPDRRVQKTQKLLHEALGSLIREKSYDSIVVKEILERANVGRSTFYTHYQNKDELLVSGVNEILGAIPPSTARAPLKERLIAFSLPILRHLERHVHANPARMGTRAQAILHERLREILADLVSRELKKGPLPGSRKWAGQVPSELLAQYRASSFILVLHWWLDSKSRLGPKEVDGIFRTLVLPALSGL